MSQPLPSVSGSFERVIKGKYKNISSFENEIENNSSLKEWVTNATYRLYLVHFKFDKKSFTQKTLMHLVYTNHGL